MNIKPNEICFLNYLDGLEHTNNLPDYWKYNYGINPNIVSKKLLNNGLIEFKLDIERNISNLTIPQLKEILRSNNLSFGGKKSELISRILGNVDINTLEQKFSKKRFCLTFKGKELIENNYLFIINQKENYNFNDEDIFNIYKLYSNENNKDKLIKLFHYVIKKDIKNKDYSNLDLRILQLYNFYLKIDMFDEALFYYIVSFKLHLFNFQTYNNEVYLNDVKYINFDDTFLRKLKNVISLTNYDENKLYNIIISEDITTNLPFHYFSNEDCYKILIDLLHNKPFNILNYNINKPTSNSKEYIYYDFNDTELFNNSSIKVSSTNNHSKGLINNILNTFFKKGKH